MADLSSHALSADIRKVKALNLAFSTSAEPPCIESDLLLDLRQDLAQVADRFDPSHFRIRGVWTTRYWLQLLPTSTAFDLTYLLVQTEEIGCCYIPSDSLPSLNASNLLGASIFEHFDYPGLQVAALDAGYGCLPKDGEESVLEGRNFEKAAPRAKLICNEVKRLLPRPEGQNRVGVVGVVGELIHELSAWPETQIRATDFATRVAGSVMDGIEIDWGMETAEMVASVDVAVVTGMTLANGSLEEILRAARQADTKLVIFAETGHNFGPKYLQLGVDAVIAEDFPFYLSSTGPSRFRVERQGTNSDGD